MEITPEIQAEIDKATEGLKNKNTELLTSIAKNKPLLDKIANLDIDKLIADSTALADLQKKNEEEKGEYKKLYEGLQSTSSTEQANLKKQIEDLKIENSNMSKRNAIHAQLSKINVDPVLLDTAIGTIMPKAAIDDKGTVMIDGKSVEDFTKEWSETDFGKKFIISGNSGGGSNGGGGGSTEQTSKYFDPESVHFSITEQAKVAKENIGLYNKLKEKYAGKKRKVA